MVLQKHALRTSKMLLLLQNIDTYCGSMHACWIIYGWLPAGPLGGAGGARGWSLTRPRLEPRPNGKAKDGCKRRSIIMQNNSKRNQSRLFSFISFLILIALLPHKSFLKMYTKLLDEWEDISYYIGPFPSTIFQSINY